MAMYENPGQSDDWYTPRYIFDALGLSFDLDPASPIEGPRYVPARHWFYDAGLERDWFGLVWLNPPFGNQNQKRKWLTKFFEHGSGIALLPDRSSAPWFQEFVPRADAQCWVAPKIKFERPDGSIGKSPGTGTVLIAVGETCVNALANSDLGFCTRTIRENKNDL